MSAPQKRGPITSLIPTVNTRRAKCLEETKRVRMVRDPEQDEVKAAADLMAQLEIRSAVRDGARVKVKGKARARVRVKAKVEVRDRAEARGRAGDKFLQKR